MADLEIEVSEKRGEPGAWIVEAIGEDGEVYQAEFRGPCAEARAKAYEQNVRRFQAGGLCITRIYIAASAATRRAEGGDHCIRCGARDVVGRPHVCMEDRL